MNFHLKDAFGMALRDAADGLAAWEIVERSDGYIAPGAGPELYLADHDEWPQQEKWAMTHVHGRVLDLGCAGGRHALYLQERGHEVVAIDSSLLAVDVAQELGVTDARVGDIHDLPDGLGQFDSILLLGNNGGFLSNRETAPILMSRLAGLAGPGAALLIQSLDPGEYPRVLDTAWQRANVAAGNYPGQLRIRIRYEQAASEWFDCLFLGPNDLDALARSTGWSLIEASAPWEGMFTAVLRRTE